MSNLHTSPLVLFKFLVQSESEYVNLCIEIFGEPALGCTVHNQYSAVSYASQDFVFHACGHEFKSLQK